MHEFELVDGAAATSGIGRRSWRGRGGRPTQQLIDPATGRPAWTGVVQATALARTALEAEILAKAALLAARLRTTHEALSLATLAALAVHALSLLGDSFLRPSLADLAIPFVGPYRPVWTAAGIIAGYGLAALSLSYYARARIGVARWKKLHRYIAVFWLLGVVHMLGAGTDAGEVWFLVLAAIVVLPPLVLLGQRVWERSAPAPGSARTALR